MTTDELMFWNKKPQLLPIYEALRDRLTRAYPDMQIKVSKTQISFRNRHIFAMASLPVRRLKGWTGDYLLVSFGLPQHRQSPRIAQAVEPYPNRWTHHVPVKCAEEIDAELMGWLEEAYRFSAVK